MIKLVNTLETVVGYDFYADVSDRMVEGRKKLGITQKQLSEKSGVALSEISSYERVKARMKLESLQKLADALGLTFDQLIGAEYDDPDCEECLYTVERYKDSYNFILFFKARSPQEAFLKAYEWSLKNGFIWFETRSRALVKLKGTPVKKKDLARFPKRKDQEELDSLDGPDVEAKEGIA